MSNVHQLVNELATYEQQRKRLEDDLTELDSNFLGEEDLALEMGTLRSDEFEMVRASYLGKRNQLEEQLDKVYTHIDDLEDAIDRSTNGSYGFDDDEY
jgi:chaperonin cofactor prefoldin